MVDFTLARCEERESAVWFSNESSGRRPVEDQNKAGESQLVRHTVE